MNVAPAKAPVMGTRLPEDAVTFPDIGLHHSRRAGVRTVSPKDGTPRPGWPRAMS